MKEGRMIGVKKEENQGEEKKDRKTGRRERLEGGGEKTISQIKKVHRGLQSYKQITMLQNE